MGISEVIIRSFLSIVALFFSAKVIGNKQMSQLNMFDYINGITIGSIGAEAAIEDDGQFYIYIVAIGVYTIVIWLITFISSKSIKIRRVFNGRSILLMNSGKMFANNFKTAKIDMDEFLTQSRINGYFNIDDIESAVLEQNGKISFLPKSDKRPPNNQELHITVPKSSINETIILNGEVLFKNLEHCGRDEEWLKKELHRLSIGNVKDIFYAFFNDKNELSVYPLIKDAPKNDMFG